MTNSVFVWDQQYAPGDEVENVLLWQSYADNNSLSSIPRYLEDHAERLRDKYLAFIHDLGQSRIGGKRVVDHLDDGDGFSLWWMTQLAEKSPFKSPQIYDCLRLMALEEMLVERKPHELTLDSPDRHLAQAVRTLCQNLQINFIWCCGEKAKQKWALRNIYRFLPYSLQALISLRHLLAKWPLRKLQRPQWFSGDETLFMCSYFFNLDAASCADGHFYSRQWEGLPDIFKECEKRSNWIHHFLLSPGTPDVKTGQNWVRQFNRDADKQGYHAFLEVYLSWGVIFRALNKWIWLNVVSWRLRKISCAFSPEGSAVWLWPLLQRDWQTSLTGPVALCNCLWIELFDIALKEMPRQKTGLYLWENQGWESALIRAWRRHGHGEIIGVPHATVIFWHLNNFDDPRSLDSNQSSSKPLPDHLAINGPMAWKALVSTGYPSERLVEVEALRFQYLNTLGSGKSEKVRDSLGIDELSGHGVPKKILILGDFTIKQTLKMLQCVRGALEMISDEISVTLKPHPVCRIGMEDCPGLCFALTNKPLAEIMQNFDLAFASNSTSAGVDALLAGLPVVVFLDGDDFNHSPLRGVEGIQFVGTAEELASQLQSCVKSATPYELESFFWLNGKMPRWRKVLSKSRNNG